MKMFFFAYLALLTVLLLCREPSKLIVIDTMGLLEMLSSVSHLVSFLVLTVLALTPRWILPHWTLPRWAIVAGLATYGGATELLQHFVSARSPEWSDWLQDLAGIAIGTAIWGMAAIAWHCWTQRVDPAQ